MPEEVAPAPAAAPAAAPATGTPSTPPVASSAPASPAPAPAAAPAAPAAPEAPTQPSATPSAAAPKDGATPAAAPSEPAPAPVGPLFKLPEDVKLADAAVAKFDASVRPLLGPDGKLSLTPQQLADLFVDQARDGQVRWQQQITEQNAAWEAESRQRFSTQQLAAAETGVGFLSSFDPAFRELSREFKNNPTFVNAMRVVGERLSEDKFEIDGTPAPAAQKRSRAQVMGYAKS